ncbi:MAG: glutathione S-transferase protein [Thermoleophilia bacterium]|nr:glutathione S-transferase protein [Thermoleophilia bacterium]
MLLYTCPARTSMGSVGHPCGAASKALDAAGLEYEVKVVGGFKNVPFTTMGGKRDEIIELTGKSHVPVLKLDDGRVIAGSATIVEWARAQSAS